ncbi:hypothetical protein Glove_194g107 [Diversispora epigaea]|uniref:MD-2-related lipid-recognition domain-containing protein n=1 Tax=Diversispora epigaea TaxID=1348612 RepID=A0A397IL64_9GLOM|nr:hypothetical protein Glove_194g107 [Diversispora epigaea]
MNQSLILVFILLTTLFGWNISSTCLTTSLDPLIQGQDDTFSVSGNSKSGATNVLGIRFFKDLTKGPLYTFPTRVFGAKVLPICPVNPFKMDYKIKVSRRLSDLYFLAVVGDPKAQTILGCAVKRVRSEKFYPIASYSIASYPIASYPFASYPIASYPIAE